MKELIRRLARKAGFTRLSEDKYAALSDEQVEEFARLIANECAELSSPAKKKIILEKFGLNND